MATTKQAAAAAKAAPENPVMAYIGPTIFGVVRQGTVLKGGVPEALIEKIEQVKQLRALLVPVTGFAGAWKAVNTPGTAEHSLHQSAMQCLYPEIEEQESGVNFDG